MRANDEVGKETAGARIALLPAPFCIGLKCPSR
jgi:hypothetical protein